MSEIKLPVETVIYDPRGVIFIDKAGDEVALEAIVAALNAAPKRAFADLTAEALKEMRDAARDRGINSAGLPKQGEGMPRHWRRCNAAIDAEFLSLLQAFAAPA
jgi:hypothetical protein